MTPLSSPNLFKVSAFIFVSFVCFYLGRHWSDGYQQLIFFSTARPSHNAAVTISPNSNNSYDVSSLIAVNQTHLLFDPLLVPAPAAPPSPELDSIKKFGIISENGTMSDEFEIGDFDPDLVETEWGNDNETEKTEGSGDKPHIKKFSMCSETMREIIPCLDNAEAIKQLKSTEKGEKFERHCPGTGLNCLVPPPKGYKQPIPWPRSRDEVFGLSWLNDLVGYYNNIIKL